MQRVEVLRGPASTLYGGWALAEVVAMSTRTPEDFLWRGNARLAGGGSAGMWSRDNSEFGSANLAATNGPWSGLVLLARHVVRIGKQSTRWRHLCQAGGL
ncbi:hypothetical protein [Dokdonella sp.]|uniref:hypothetical protein n=1 Tax=Dokdonella sp. TaxID=2291710 RepID=UPI0035290D23